ncbi:hypothetical protein [Streptomyces sp. NPDC090798]|uniref:hypothetical protein n=1 Tax=Streptomyces sp. NPDC090798 TaxID=3365968 RepID=UPI003829ACF0
MTRWAAAIAELVPGHEDTTRRKTRRFDEISLGGRGIDLVRALQRPTGAGLEHRPVPGREVVHP